MVRSRGRFAALPLVCAALVGCLLSFSTDAAAQPPARQSRQSSVGFQGGGSIDPEQMFAGVFWETPPIGGRLAFRAGLDGGFGDDLRVATINIDFVVNFPLTNSWTLVQGGGPVIAIWRDPELDVSETSAGGSYMLEFTHDRGFFAGFRIGGGNTPNLKFGAGYRIKF